MQRPHINQANTNNKLWVPFPGFEVAFAAEWSSQPVWNFSIDRAKLIEASRHPEPHERAYNVVNYYLEGLKRANKRDEKIGVGICIIPDEVWKNCRMESQVSDPLGERVSNKIIKSRKSGQLELFGEYNLEQYYLSPDFRRQLKARGMEFSIPLQLIRESTLTPKDEHSFGERLLTPISDRMWNISTALYYKCGGKPWRLTSAREGVCYIGIAFRRLDPNTQDRTACCAAQMFLDSGDGIVFLGEYGPWYSEKEHQFHLSRKASASLLKGILETYKQLEGKPLKEVFLHSRSDISNHEFEGYLEACPEGVKLVGVRVKVDRKYTPKLYRLGDYPVLRGTFVKVNEKSGLLWGSGFKTRLGTYDGWEVPIPLRIDIQHGDASVIRVAHDILGLTKLNYNACRLGESQPVTVNFSDAVGEILISNPAVEHRRPNFKYYI